MPRQQNLRKCKVIVDLRWRCSLGALEKAAEWVCSCWCGPPHLI